MGAKMIDLSVLPTPAFEMMVYRSPETVKEMDDMLNRIAQKHGQRIQAMKDGAQPSTGDERVAGPEAKHTDDITPGENGTPAGLQVAQMSTKDPPPPAKVSGPKAVAGASEATGQSIWGSDGSYKYVLLPSLRAQLESW